MQYNLIRNVYYLGYDRIIIHRENLADSFFDLKNKMGRDLYCHESVSPPELYGYHPGVRSLRSAG